MFFIMLGFTFFSASMSVGAKLGNGLDFKGFALAVLIGSVILSAYTGILGYIGSKTGMSLDLLAQRSFGKFGSFLPSALITFTQIGWFGVGVAMFAVPAAEVLNINPLWLIAAAGLCMTASAYFGVKGLEIVSYISVPLIAALGIYSMVTATNDGGGLIAIFAKIFSEVLFPRFPLQTNLFFIGLILGGLPIIYRKVKGVSIKLPQVLAFLLFFMLVTVLAVVGEGGGADADITIFNPQTGKAEFVIVQGRTLLSRGILHSGTPTAFCTDKGLSFYERKNLPVFSVTPNLTRLNRSLNP